jgi:hypothetical protein
MNRSPLQLLILGVVLVVSVIFGLRAARPVRPALDRDLHALVGRVLAEETAKRLGENKSVVVLLPEASFDMPLVDSQFRAFKSALSKTRGLRIAATETVRLDRMGPLDGLLTPARYFELARKHASAAALISFVGLAAFSEDDLRELDRGMPSIHVISANAAVPQRLFDTSLVGLAIVPRGSARAVDDGTGREIFNRAYEVVASATGSKR